MMNIPPELTGILPSGPLQRIQRFARDLAWGATLNLWSPQFNLYSQTITELVDNAVLQHYLETVWAGTHPPLQVLVTLGYLHEREIKAVGPSQVYKFALTERAFDLLAQKDQAILNIFISYRRSISSTLAVLTWTYLRNVGLDPFIDIYKLTLGDEWRSVLEAQIRKSDVMIGLVSQSTFQSETVRYEVELALATNTRMILLLHDGFSQADLVHTPFPQLADLQLYELAPAAKADAIYNAMEYIRFSLGILQR